MKKCLWCFDVDRYRERMLSQHFLVNIFYLLRKRSTRVVWITFMLNVYAFSNFNNLGPIKGIVCPKILILS